MGTKTRCFVVFGLAVCGLVSLMKEFNFSRMSSMLMQQDQLKMQADDGMPLVSAEVGVGHEDDYYHNNNTTGSHSKDEQISNEEEEVRIVPAPLTTPASTNPPPTSPAPTKSPPPRPNLEDFRRCKVDPTPQVGEAPIAMNGTFMPVEYQCDGEPYHQFASLLEEQIAADAVARAETSPRWGRRRLIVPYNKQGRTILILGNSHTRQLVSTLLCQYRDQILHEPKSLYSMPGLASYGVLEFQLKNNVTIYSATNCPFIYSDQWPETLQTVILNRSLASMDAIIMGRFNAYSQATGTQFMVHMLEYQAKFPEWNLDFEHAKIPTLESISQIYEGPIVYVGMFAKYGDAPLREANATVQANLPGRSNLGVIDGRQYIQKLKEQQPSQPVYECASDTRGEVATCVLDPESRRFQNGHRCMGARGGHPDLIAWDVVDYLHQVLADPSSKIEA